ncbi:alkaline phosphatase family protein [Halosimplex aquaticum]|uniref:Alkaline phosphatase family protein n=1 Tax=Halosimplex aquaticum TaxID=3026162 RepID=A0ABD5XWN0_9EURY|nr:alkaline phosphatase family protein [Halosimplex aquaticum]
MDGSNHSADQAFVLGLDGVPWSLLQGWITEGELPNLTRLIEEGAAGPLESTTPATTALAWPSIATGARPDKHGIYGFRKITPSYTPQMYTSHDRQQPALWDVLSPAVVGNVPMTYPAQPIDGKLVSGMMTPEIDDQFSSPPELGRELLDRVPEYEIGLDWSEYVGREEELLSDLSALVEKRRELLRLLMETEDWRLFFFVFTAPDRLQHLVWDEAVLLEHYRQLDDVVGEVIDYVERLDATLYVVSDHGFGPLSKFVAANRVFETEGLLSRQEGTGTQSLLSRFGVSRDRIISVLSKAGISGESIVNTVPERLLRVVGRQFPGDDVLFDVDYSETEVFTYDHGRLYINDESRFVDGCVAPEDRQAVKAEVKDALEGITDPQTGAAPVTVRDGDDLFPTDPHSPDLIVETAPEYESTGRLSQDPFVSPGEKTASHRSEGIMIAWGPNVKAGGSPIDASVYDIAPTLLHGVGEPVPASTDGRVLTEIFEPASPAAETVPTSVTYEGNETAEVAGEDFEDVEDRLTGLGYLE